MNMKKSLVAGVALTMVASLGLAGCGSNGGVEKRSEEHTSELQSPT